MMLLFYDINGGGNRGMILYFFWNYQISLYRFSRATVICYSGSITGRRAICSLEFLSSSYTNKK